MSLWTAPWSQKPPPGTPVDPGAWLRGGSNSIQFYENPVNLLYAFALNEGAGLTFAESVTRKRGTFLTSQRWKAGLDGVALTGTNSASEGGSISGLPAIPNINNRGFTIEVIFRYFSGSASGGIFCRGTGAQPDPFTMYMFSGTFNFRVGDGSSNFAFSISNPPVNKRAHVIITVGQDPAHANWQFVYMLNGVVQTTTTTPVSQAIVDHANPIFLNQRGDLFGSLAGELDMCAIWDGALTLDMAHQRYIRPYSLWSTAGLHLPGKASSTPPPPGPSGNWHFMSPQFQCLVDYMAATASRQSKITFYLARNNVVITGGQADTTLQWFLANTPPSLKWSF